MKMFLGEYNPNLTEGSRLALPKKMREQIKDKTLVLTRGFEKCIYLYDKEDWSQEAEKQINSARQDALNTKTRDLQRYIYSTALEVSIDSQGRFVVPSPLLEYAEIDGETAVVGVGNRVEIWDKKKWANHFNSMSQELSQ